MLWNEWKVSMGKSQREIQGFWSKATYVIFRIKNHKLLKNSSWHPIWARIMTEHLAMRCQVARTAQQELGFVRSTNL